MIIRKALALTIVFSAFVAVAFMAWQRLSFDTDPLKLLPQDEPEVLGLVYYQEYFGKEVDLMILVESEDAEKTERAVESLAGYLVGRKDLTERVTWQRAGLGQPEFFAETLAYFWWNAEPESVRALTKRLNDAVEVERSLNAAMATMTSSFDGERVGLLATDPLGLTDSITARLDLKGRGPGRLAFGSEDGTMRILFVNAPDETFDYKKSGPWLDRVRGGIDDWKKSAGELANCRVEMTGTAPYIVEVATTMQGEMLGSAILTISIILFLFWLFYRCTVPLFWLTFCLFFTFAITLLLGSFIFGKLGAMSVGFAAILVGLCVDYGFIVYQEWSTDPKMRPRDMRKNILGSVIWAAFTTAMVFAGLNLSRVPGAAQLGSMVAIGIVTGASIMMTLFPWLLSLHPTGGRGNLKTKRTVPAIPGRSITVLVGVLGLGILIWRGVPGMMAGESVLEPRHSKTRELMEYIVEKAAAPDRHHVHVVFEERDGLPVRKQMKALEKKLAKIPGATPAFPYELWPEPNWQSENMGPLAEVAKNSAAWKVLFADANFSDEGFLLTEKVLSYWADWGSRSTTASWIYPEESHSREILDKVAAPYASPPLAMGTVILDGPEEERKYDEALANAAKESGVYIANWSQLRPAIQKLLKSERSSVLLPLSGLVLVMLVIAFRRARDVILAASTFLFSAVVLLALMQLVHLGNFQAKDFSILGMEFTLDPTAMSEWNIVNLAAVPLMLGAGLDYSIHMLMAIRRGRDVNKARNTTGRALLLCGLSSVTGFATLSTSSNPGLGGMGMMCATGLLITMFAAVFLLPSWARPPRLKKSPQTQKET